MPKAPGYLFFLALAAYFSWLLTPFSEAQTPPVRIMPMGDSLTSGYPIAGGYRKHLYDLLTTAGYNVDFVGTSTINPVAGLPDSDHEGHGGWRIRELSDAVGEFLAASDAPDVILLNIGTNDMNSYWDVVNPGHDFTWAITYLDPLITKIVQQRPFAHIIVTNLLQRDASSDALIQAYFNPFVPGIVTYHQSLGHRVTFLDMRAAVPFSDMPDQLHPNQVGYNKMAAAWASAIQTVIAPLGDNLPPAIASAQWVDATHVSVTFSKPVEDIATALANFSIGGLTISAATLDAPTKRTITLTTSTMPAGTLHTLAVSNVRDRLAVPNVIAPGATATFWTPAVPAAPDNIPEKSSFSLVYTLNVPSFAQYNTGYSPPAYAVDKHSLVGAGSFTRVAYYLELQKPGGPLEFCWVSMDAFTTDPGKLGVPYEDTGAVFQQPVASMRVASNVPGIANGSGLTGNIEFWPTSYGTANAANVPGADGTRYDFGDQNSPFGDYGSMQIHHPAASQTLISFNSWALNYPPPVAGTPHPVDVGLGNNTTPAAHPDWTLAKNADEFSVRRLQVFVFPGVKETRLSNLVLSGVPPTPAFASETASYSATVVNGTSSITVTPTVFWPNATVTVNGNSVASGNASAPIALNVGVNSISVVVTAQDGVSTRSYSVQVTRSSIQPSYYQTWAAAQGLGGSGPGADWDSDGSSNLLELAFGTDPKVASPGMIDLTVDFGPPWTGTINAPGKPVMLFANTPTGVDMRAVFGRRVDYIAAGLTYTVEFSPDLISWQASSATPVVIAPGGVIEAVSVPYPFFVNGKKPRFFRVAVTEQ